MSIEKSLLKGPTMLVYSENDPVTITKTVVNLQRVILLFTLKGAAMGAMKALNVNMYAMNLQSYHHLISFCSKMIGLIQAPNFYKGC